MRLKNISQGLRGIPIGATIKFADKGEEVDFEGIDEVDALEAMESGDWEEVKPDKKKKADAAEPAQASET